MDLPNIKTKLSLFKTFAINLNIEKNDDLELIRQGATNQHKDDNDYLHAFCIIIVFEKFKGEDLILNELGIIIEIKSGYMVLLRSTLLEYFNSRVKTGNRFSIIFYLKKVFYYI